MIAQQFLTIVGWSLFATLLISAIGLAIPKIWPLPIIPTVWLWSWLGGGLAAGLLVAAVWTYCVRQRPLAAAMEIDRRFRLKERVSSALAMLPGELDSEAGRALLDDAVRRVERIDVRDGFPVNVPKRALLPLVPAVAMFVLALFVPDATPPKDAQAASNAAAEADQVRKSAEALKKRLERAEKKAEDKGLKDADVLLKELKKGLEELANKDDVDRKNALVKLNDLAKNVEQRRERLGGADRLKQQFDKLKDLERGPADKVAQAIKDGDLQAAVQELKRLKEALEKGNLTDEEKKQLEKQLDKFKKKMDDAAAAHHRAKEDLKNEIERRKNEGDLAGAGKLQEQLDKLSKLDDQMQRMQQVADKLGQCKQCLQRGDAQNAAQQLEQLAQNLQDLKAQLDELQALDDILDQIADAKDAMKCEKCHGEGCEACMGGGGKGDDEGPPGEGLGEGRGKGERPEEKTDTNAYDSKVKGKIQKGEAVRTGTASGPNRAGKSQEDIKEQIRASLNQEADPLTDVRLPKNERQHTKQYFERIRKGG
jgi:hypothetical protein